MGGGLLFCEHREAMASGEGGHSRRCQIGLMTRDEQGLGETTSQPGFLFRQMDTWCEPFQDEARKPSVQGNFSLFCPFGGF